MKVRTFFHSAVPYLGMSLCIDRHCLHYQNRCSCKWEFLKEYLNIRFCAKLKCDCNFILTNHVKEGLKFKF